MEEFIPDRLKVTVKAAPAVVRPGPGRHGQHHGPEPVWPARRRPQIRGGILAQSRNPSAPKQATRSYDFHISSGNESQRRR